MKKDQVWSFSHGRNEEDFDGRVREKREKRVLEREGRGMS